MLDLAIIGAGPYGISLAAHAVESSLEYKLFGYPMDFWKNKMPQDMYIRTPHDFVSFSDPNDEFTIHSFAEERGIELVTPLPRPIFVDYGMWFVNKTGVEFTPYLISSVTFDGDKYTMKTENGEMFNAKNMIVATGVEHYKFIPDIFESLSPTLLSHTSGYTNFEQFSGKSVLVMGSGQSAWEAAALLHKEGAEVELVYRREKANYSGSRQAEIDLRDLGDVFYNLPLDKKKLGWGQSPGSIAHFLRPYVEGKVKETGNTAIVSAEPTEDEAKVILMLSNGEERIVDHVISASGFRINIDKVPFFNRDVKSMIAREEGFIQFPRLNDHFESSLPGLYFAGPLSSHSHGPTFRFILGLRKTSMAIIPSIKRKQKVITN